MSYDIDLRKRLDGEDHIVFEVGNYTSNVAPMWERALTYPIGDLHEALVTDGVLIDLHAARNLMRNNPDEYRAMNPANGHGDYEGALAYLERLLLGCRLHPDAVIYVSN